VPAHHRLARPRPGIAKKPVTDVVLDREIEGADAARARDPPRGRRLLDGPWPEVPRRELVVPAVPRKDVARLPGLERERERLTITLAMLHRRDAIAEVDIHRTAERQAGHQPPAPDAVEHAVFFGDSNRPVVGAT